MAVSRDISPFDTGLDLIVALIGSKPKHSRDGQTEMRATLFLSNRQIILPAWRREREIVTSESYDVGRLGGFDEKRPDKVQH
jgi:hypothetical protein